MCKNQKQNKQKKNLKDSESWYFPKTVFVIPLSHIVGHRTNISFYKSDA